MLVFDGSQLRDLSDPFDDNQLVFNDLWELRCEKEDTDGLHLTHNSSEIENRQSSTK